MATRAIPTFYSLPRATTRVALHRISHGISHRISFQLKTIINTVFGIIHRLPGDGCWRGLMGHRVALNFCKMENQNNGVRTGGKCEIIPDPNSDEEVYRINLSEGSLEDADYYTTTDSIVSKNGCAAGVKALRKGFEMLLTVHTDSRFTGRLMKIVAEIFRRDFVKGKMKKSVLFSQERSFLSTIVLNIRKRVVDRLRNQIKISHCESRAEATISVIGLGLKRDMIPGGASHFRILHHLSIVSDYRYSKLNRRYEPVSMLNGMCAYGYTDYLEVGGIHDIGLKVEFQDGVCPLEEDTVIQCIGIEFYQKSGEKFYSPFSGGSGVSVWNVF